MNSSLSLEFCSVLKIYAEGQFTYWKSVRDFFRTKGFIRIFDGFFLKTKGFLPKVYEIFWSEMPLDICSFQACSVKFIQQAHTYFLSEKLLTKNLTLRSPKIKKLLFVEDL